MDAFEVRAGLSLPASYRDLLSRVNSGRPVPSAFHLVGDLEHLECVGVFLGIDAGEHRDLETYLSTYAGRIPVGLLPIAFDPGGNLICLRLADGSVWVWDHELEGDDEPVLLVQRDR